MNSTQTMADGEANSEHVAADSAAAPTNVVPDFAPRAVYTLGFLTLISTFNYLDRSILGLALPAIKKEMQLSDTMLGLVSGLAFVIFYSLLGVPIAWLADRFSRRNIIAIGFAFWSLMTVLTGFVANVWQLAAARFLMGAGEACGLAPSNAMLSDLFRAARRPLALSIFGTANSIAFTLFFPIAGLIAETRGWRAMFVAAGIPGLVLALLFALSVREPARGALEEVAREREETKPESLSASLAFLAGARSYLWMLLGCMFMGSNAFAAGAWTPTFLTRVHGLKMSEIASTIGPIRGVVGALGILTGGLLIDRLGKRDARWRLRLPAFACLVTGPAELLFLLGDTRTLWMAGFALTSLFTLVHMGPIFAAALAVTKLRMRALATSIMVLAASLLGQAVGPLMVGFLNDLLAPSLGAHAIRYSLLITAGTAIAAGICFWAAEHHFERDVLRANQAT
jgi:MFS family permease